jgi:L-methionine (R)-S-oxide reductase
MAMKLSDSVVQNLRDLFTDIGMDGSLEDCLNELSALVGRVLSAKGCAIMLLTEEEAKRAELCNRAGFGFLPGTPGKVRKALPATSIRTKSGIASNGEDKMLLDSMFSTIVLHGKVIGVIHAVLPQQQSSFSKDDLDLFSILTPIITKSIQVIQLQHLLRSRFTQVALIRSSEDSVRAMLSGVMQNPNQIARILAKSFYREMLNAGFSFNQILFAATEVISELSATVRKHGARRKQLAMDGAAQPARLLEGVHEEFARRPGGGGGSAADRISA